MALIIADLKLIDLIASLPIIQNPKSKIQNHRGLYVTKMGLEVRCFFESNSR